MSIYCSKCGAPNADSAQFCEKCGNRLNGSVEEAPQQVSGQKSDQPNIGYNILGFIIPLVGVILYFSWKDKMPHKAKSILTWSAISAGIGFAYAITSL